MDNFNTFRCITNNPLLVNKKHIGVEEVQGSVFDIMVHTKKKLLKGHRLITHPLTGSISPAQNPYKSIIISGNCHNYVIEDIHIIDYAIEYTKKLTSYISITWDQETLEDLSFIDYEFIKNYFTIQNN